MHDYLLTAHATLCRDFMKRKLTFVRTEFLCFYFLFSTTDFICCKTGGREKGEREEGIRIFLSRRLRDEGLKIL